MIIVSPDPPQPSTRIGRHKYSHWQAIERMFCISSVNMVKRNGHLQLNNALTLVGADGGVHPSGRAPAVSQLDATGASHAKNRRLAGRDC